MARWQLRHEISVLVHTKRETAQEHEKNGGALKNNVAAPSVMPHMSQPRQWQQVGVSRKSFMWEVNNLVDFHHNPQCAEFSFSM